MSALGKKHKLVAIKNSCKEIFFFFNISRLTWVVPTVTSNWLVSYLNSSDPES